MLHPERAAYNGMLPVFVEKKVVTVNTVVPTLVIFY